MTFDEFLDVWREAIEDSPEERPGQLLFNLLYEEDPLLADGIRGTALDPFYADDVIEEALEYISERWDNA